MQNPTPMMKQYMKIKKQYPDCLIMFRLGDFYEFFFEDAKIASEILGITLTSRSKEKDKKIPMAGIPYHSVNNYIKKLTDKNYKVAICEQLTEPNNRGIVERDVVKIITPATVDANIETDQQEAKYIFTYTLSKNRLAFAFLEPSTGELYFFEKTLKEPEIFLFDLIQNLPIREIILSQKDIPERLRKIADLKNIFINQYEPEYKNLYTPEEFLKEKLKVSSLKAFALEKNGLATGCVALLLEYLDYTQKSSLSEFISIKEFSLSNYLAVDSATLRNLEIFPNQYTPSNQATVFSFFNHCKTALGKRLLYQWFLNPLQNKEKIEKRQNSIETLFNNPQALEKIREFLGNISDIERITTRMINNSFNVDDFIRLKNSIEAALQIRHLIKENKLKSLEEIAEKIDQSLLTTAEEIGKTIIEDPLERSEQNLIKKGINPELDELKSLLFSTQEYLSQLEIKEREKTQIPTLKIKYNKVFGFYIEVSKSYTKYVPERYIRKQTLVNAERYITAELKEYEEKILSAQDRIQELEKQIIEQLKNNILKESKKIKVLSQKIAEIDCLSNLSFIARENNYTKPEITEEKVIKIKNGRHPLVEKFLTDKPFSPNDTYLNKNDKQILIITGPNMAGKSVYIRQVALICYLAHIGSFVPAEKAKISLLDRISVRSGAGDIITQGISTFMLEMIETANIIHNITDNSLVVLDEIGRGTSTYDGISIAWAIAEYLAKTKGKQAYTLFATHYHELQALEKYFSNVKNYQMAIDESSGEPVFIYKLIPGASSHSYGIHAAKLAGMPKEIIKRAEKVLQILEGKTKGINLKQPILQQFSLFQAAADSPVIKALKEIDPDNLTPLEALKLIYKLKKEI